MTGSFSTPSPLLVLVTLSLTGLAKAIHNDEITLRMPDIRPDHGEQYLCMAHRIVESASGHFIVGFNPKSNADRVHHMLMYGCERPGIFQRDSPNFVWDCSEMHQASPRDSNNQFGKQDAGTTFEEGPVCQNERQGILYGWALDAPGLKLPDGVGFEIGGSSGIKFLVLQVHYGHYGLFQQMPSLTDNSGLVLDVKRNDQNSGITRRAGVMLMLSMGAVTEGKSKHKIWCEIQDAVEVHPFRFRVHTHKLGTRVRGIKIGRRMTNKLGFDIDETNLIGMGNPQDPQMFYPVRDSNITLTKGDKVYATCEFDNDKGHIVRIGQTGDDEMCNFYMMYWTDSKNLLSNSHCVGWNGLPRTFESSLLNTYPGAF